MKFVTNFKGFLFCFCVCVFPVKKSVLSRMLKCKHLKDSIFMENQTIFMENYTGNSSVMLVFCSILELLKFRENQTKFCFPIKQIDSTWFLTSKDMNFKVMFSLTIPIT